MNNKVKVTSSFKDVFALVVIPTTIFIAVLLFYFVLGNPSNFVEGNSENHPLNILGIVYKGGIIVPLLMSFFLMVLIFSIERHFTIGKAFGNGSLNVFLKDVKEHLHTSSIESAIKRCDEHQGSVGNVVYASLKKYEQLKSDNHLPREQKVVALQKEVEEATALELPLLEKNLTIIATLASIATLVGLLGTVVGMIKAFAALATTGTPDPTALANGISEALINTALGIATSALAIVAYNYFTSRVDALTYSIDEISFSVSQSFAASTK